MNTHAPTWRVAMKRVLGIGAIAATLITAGCGSSSDNKTGDVPMRTGEFIENQPGQQAKKQGVFDFTINSPRQAQETLTFELPKALLEQIPKEKPMATKVVAKAHSLKSMDLCAIDLEITYSDDVPQAIITKSMDAGSSGSWNLSLTPMSEFDEANPKRGGYASDDRKTFTEVLDCVAGPGQSDNFSRMNFGIPAHRTDQTGDMPYGALGRVKLSVMKSGTLIIQEADVFGYKQDAQGNWIKG